MNIIPAQTTTVSVLLNLTTMMNLTDLTGAGSKASPLNPTVVVKALAPPVTLVANGLVGVEVVTVEVSSDEGVTHAPALDVTTGAPIELSASKNIININSFGRYRVVKGVTVNSVAVSVSNAVNL